MSTRHAEPDSPLRQERWASSPAFAAGLKANLVARRLSIVEDAADRSLIWFLQFLSMKNGMEPVAAQLLERYADRIGTKSMQNVSADVCKAHQVKSIRSEIPHCSDKFLLRGELTEWEQTQIDFAPTEKSQMMGDNREIDRQVAEIKERANRRAQSYALSDFQEHCLQQACECLAEYLIELCLNPETELSAPPWYFAALADCLRDWQSAWIEDQQKNFVQTATANAVHAAIDFASQTRQMVLATGPLGSGVSFAAKSWCKRFPGSARYVLVPASNDRKSFFMAIADALGVPDGLRSKARELQERCEAALEMGDLTLVFDNANDLLPNTNLRESMPDRVQWILSALLPKGIPVVFFGLPNFLEKMQLFNGKGGWTIEEFTYQCDCRELPELSFKEVAKIGSIALPGIEAKKIADLSSYACSSRKFLATIRAAVRAADYEARSASRPQVSGEDVAKAVKMVEASDQLLERQRPKAKLRNNRVRLETAPPTPRHAIAPVPRESRAAAIVSSTSRDNGQTVLAEMPAIDAGRALRDQSERADLAVE